MTPMRQLVGEVLRARRAAQGLTLRDVSAKARVSLGYISEIERGQKEPSSELLAAVAAALDLPLSEVLLDVGAMLALEEATELSLAANTELSLAANTELSLAANTELSLAANTELSLAANTELSLAANTELSLAANTELASVSSLLPSGEVEVSAA